MTRALLIALLAAPVLFCGQVRADEAWLPPHKEKCSLEPGQDCGADIKCPETKAYVMSGGGGFPQVSDENHRIAMTMNLPVNSNTWRVRWRNFGDKKVELTGVIRVLCSDEGDLWGQ